MFSKLFLDLAELFVHKNESSMKMRSFDQTFHVLFQERWKMRNKNEGNEKNISMGSCYYLHSISPFQNQVILFFDQVGNPWILYDNPRNDHFGALRSFWAYPSNQILLFAWPWIINDSPSCDYFQEHHSKAVNIRLSRQLTGQCVLGSTIAISSHHPCGYMGLITSWTKLG